jgi:hypothetical protein
MAALPLIITTAGRNAIVNANNTGTGPVLISQIALMNGPGTQITRLTFWGG